MFPLFGFVLVILLASDFIRKKYFRGQNRNEYRVLRSETFIQQISNYLKDFFSTKADKKYAYGMVGAGKAAEAHKSEGNEFLKEGKYAEAAECYGKAIECDPENPVFYSNRSAAHANLSSFDAALLDAETAIRLDAKFVKAYSRKGLALYKLGKTTKACEAYREGLKLDPSNESLQQ